MESWSIERLIRSATDRLRHEGSPSPRLDAELLLAKTLGLERAQLYSLADETVGRCAMQHFASLVDRRAGHEPVAYLLGEAFFRHLHLAVDPAVLIPRPETEELVDVALAVLRRRPAWGASSGSPAALIADVGTGSGAIALSIAQEAGLSVLATDVSEDALRVAAANAAATGLTGLVEFRRADLLDGVPDGSLHLVVSNPPYVTSGDYETLAPDVRLFEPAGALDAGPDGLDVIRRLLPEAARALRPGGTVVLEVGYDQAQAVVDLAREAGFVLTAVHRDLSGKDRTVEATLPGTHVMPAAAGAEDLARLRDALAAGAIIGVPTDTVYGLAALWDCAPGVRRLFAAKGRPRQQPVQVLFPSVDAITGALPDLAPVAGKVLTGLLPGPYTFIVATAVPRPDLVGTPDSLGVRVPDHPPVLALLRLLGVPLAATSANVSGRPDVRTLAEVDPEVLAHCSTAFESSSPESGGVAVPGSEPPAAGPSARQASTIVDLRPLTAGGLPVVLREGAVPAAEVLARIATIVP
jgi:release factor glutamine methyltransferase